MPYDAPAKPLTAFTTYEELTSEQRVRFGDYVKLKDEARARAERNQAGQERTRALLDAAGGDTAKALMMALRGAV